jgi:hypothetical protein
MKLIPDVVRGESGVGEGNPSNAVCLDCRFH